MFGNKKQYIYLDHAAATPLDPEALKTMRPFLTDSYGNAAALHSKGVHAKQAIQQARETIAKILGCHAEELIFTGSGTESNNLAILGTAKAAKSKGNHIIVSAIEHESVLKATEELTKQGFVVTYVPVSEDGIVSPNDVTRAINDKTILVSIMYANNEIGTIQPVKDIARLIKKEHPNVVFHVDGCQAAGQLSLSVKQLGADLFSFNGSKAYGPKGIGVLYKANHVTLEPIIYGGGQERGFRSGTENTAGIVGMATALKKTDALRKNEVARLEALRNFGIKKIEEAIPEAHLTGHRKKRLANNMHFTIEGIDGETLVLYLDKMGIAAAIGSACTATSVKPSHVVMAIGKSPALAKSSIRFTLGRSTTKNDLEYLIQILVTSIKKIHSLS